MRPIYTLLAAAAIVFCSCHSSRKIQNSDDAGYSSGSSRSASSAGQNDYYSTAPSDNYVRMKTTDDARWSQFDDNNSYDNYYASPMGISPYSSYGYGYSPYSFGYGMYGGFSAMSIGMGFWDPYFGWNNYFMWNMGYNPYFYNPYYGGGVLIVQQPGYYAGGGAPATGVSHVYSHLPAFNASTYRGGNFASASGRSFGNRRSVLSSSSNPNSGSGRNFSNNSSNSSSNTSNRPAYIPRNTGGNSNSGGMFGGGSSSGRSSSSGGGGGGGSFGGAGARGGFRH